MTGPQTSPPGSWPPPQPAQPTQPTQQQPIPQQPAWGQGCGGYSERPVPRELPLSKAAVTSLVFGIIGGVPLAYIFGFVGLHATGKRGSKRGRGLAIAGVVLATVWLALTIGLVALNQSQQADRNADGTVQKPGTSNIFALRPGDCLLHEGTDGGTFTEAAVVPCTQAHRSQVAAEVPLTDPGSYDVTTIQNEAEKLCTAEVPKVLASDAPSDLRLFYLVPDSNAWNLQDKRSATCVISSSNDLTKSYITG